MRGSRRRRVKGVAGVRHRHAPHPGLRLLRSPFGPRRRQGPPAVPPTRVVPWPTMLTTVLVVAAVPVAGVLLFGGMSAEVQRTTGVMDVSTGPSLSATSSASSPPTGAQGSAGASDP